jgi:hypothetical protein
MDYKYKVGQRVRVRNDLTVEQTYRMRSGPDYKNESNCVNEEMMQFCGKFVHIKAIYNGQYLLKEVGWHWTDEMFEPEGRIVCKSLL